MHHHRGDKRRMSSHFFPRLRERNTLAIRNFVVLVGTFATAWIVEDVYAIAILAQLEPQPQLGNLGIDYIWAPDQHWPSNLLVDSNLCGAQNPLIFTLGVGNSLGGASRNCEDRLHRQTRLVHKTGQPVPIGPEVLYWADRYTGVHCSLRDRRRNVGDEARIERARDQIVGAERRCRLSIGLRHQLGWLGLSNLGERPNCCKLHLLVDRRGAAVKRAAEDEGKA